ncbi:hypothetical protein M2140_001546 [Clostridiales Family XIII bacterium PM5-7]
MKSFKDFLYDKNDVLIALLILLLAGLLIFWRMEVIMDYPQTLAKKTDTVDTTTEVASPSDEPKSDDASDDPSTTDAGAATLWEDGKLTKEVTVTVQSGSAIAAVQSLIDAKLFESYDEYVHVCQAAGYTPEGIKATTFVFEKGSTQTDIAKKVTQ